MKGKLRFTMARLTPQDEEYKALVARAKESRKRILARVKGVRLEGQK